MHRVTPHPTPTHPPPPGAEVTEGGEVGTAEPVFSPLVSALFLIPSPFFLLPGHSFFLVCIGEQP